MSQKVPTFKLSVSLSNLNRLSKFLHSWKTYEICYKRIRHYPPHLRHVATLLWEIENSNFCRYSADMEENANTNTDTDTDEHHSPVISHGQSCGSAAWPLDSRLNHCLNIFFSAGTARSPLPGRLSTLPVSRNFFNSLTPQFVQLFSGNSSVNLFAVYSFKYKLVLVVEYHVDCRITLQ